MSSHTFRGNYSLRQVLAIAESVVAYYQGALEGYPPPCEHFCVRPDDVVRSEISTDGSVITKRRKVEIVISYDTIPPEKNTRFLVEIEFHIDPYMENGNEEKGVVILERVGHHPVTYHWFIIERCGYVVVAPS